MSNLNNCPKCKGKIIKSKNDWACFENKNCDYYNGKNAYDNKIKKEEFKK